MLRIITVYSQDINRQDEILHTLGLSSSGVMSRKFFVTSCDENALTDGKMLIATQGFGATVNASFGTLVNRLPQKLTCNAIKRI